jgi:hypothetical protein
MNDPSLFGLAAMALALVWFLQRWQAGRATEPAVLAMVAAGFIKHNHIVIPLTALAWLALYDRRLALRATLVGGTAAGLGLTVCCLFYGPVLLEHLAMPRSLSWLRSPTRLGGYLLWIAPALAACGLPAQPQDSSGCFAPLAS